MPFRVGQESGRRGWYVYVDRPKELRKKRGGKRNGVPPAVGTSMNQPSSLLLSSGSWVDAGVFALLLKITFAMTNAIARTDSRKPIKPIADQSLTSAFLLPL